jgi:hypothetical protein
MFSWKTFGLFFKGNLWNLKPFSFCTARYCWIKFVLIVVYVQTTSRRLAGRKVEKFEKNITKRGAVPETTTKKGKDYPVGPVLLGFFVFVVIGSCKTLLPWWPFYQYIISLFCWYSRLCSGKFDNWIVQCCQREIGNYW